MADLRLTISGTYVVNIDYSILFLHESGIQCFLSFAIPIRGSEHLLFPESLLDDWGHEINNLRLYPWLKENGSDFPRAEIFGYDQSGNTTQAFVREIDLMSNYPCFLFENVDDPIAAGNLITDIVIAAPGVLSPERTKGARLFDPPLGKAQVRWWQVDPDGFGDKEFHVLLEQL